MYKRQSLHGVGLALGSASGIDDTHLQALAALVRRIEPVRVSDHAAFARAPRRGGEAPVHGADLLPIAFTPAALDLMVAHVQRVQERLRRPLLVENIAAYLAWADDGIAEPAFFNALARRSGCGLLLDVNNLVVNALNDGVEPVAAACAWIDALDPAIVGAIHLAGYREGGALVIDDHGSRVHAPVWQVYAHALQRLGRRPTLVEWDTDLPALDMLLGEAHQAESMLQAAPTTAAAIASPAADAWADAQAADERAHGIEREAQRQRALLRALWSDDAPAALQPWLRGGDEGGSLGSAGARAQHGLRAYQGNAAATAERALGAAFPVLRQLFGAPAFAALAQACWHAHPPRSGDLTAWGDALPAFVAASAQLGGEPYLADVARLEWACHLAQHAADAPDEPADLERLASTDPRRIRLRLRPGTACVRSSYPIVAIWQAHQDAPSTAAAPSEAAPPVRAGGGDAATTDRLAVARQALADGVAEVALVWRDGWRVAVQAVASADAGFTQAMLQRCSLGDALDAAAAGFNFEGWLRQSLQQGWLVGCDDGNEKADG